MKMLNRFKPNTNKIKSSNNVRFLPINNDKSNTFRTYTVINRYENLITLLRAIYPLLKIIKRDDRFSDFCIDISKTRIEQDFELCNIETVDRYNFKFNPFKGELENLKIHFGISLFKGDIHVHTNIHGMGFVSTYFNFDVKFDFLCDMNLLIDKIEKFYYDYGVYLINYNRTSYTPEYIIKHIPKEHIDLNKYNKLIRSNRPINKFNL